MKIKETKGFYEYITRVEIVVNHLSRNGKTLLTWVVDKILRSLTNDFENTVCAIEESKGQQILSVKELVGSLDQLLQMKMWIKDEKTQKTKCRGQDQRGRGSGSGGKNQEEKEHSTQQISAK